MDIWNFDPWIGMKVLIYVTWNKKIRKKLFLIGVWAMAFQVIGHFWAKT